MRRHTAQAENEELRRAVLYLYECLEWSWSSETMSYGVTLELRQAHQALVSGEVGAGGDECVDAFLAYLRNMAPTGQTNHDEIPF